MFRRALLALCLTISGCGSDSAERPDPPPDNGVHGYANGCYAIEGYDGAGDPLYLAVTGSGDSYAFSETRLENAARFRMRAADLGTYLFFDDDGRYFTAEDLGGGQTRFGRPATLDSELTLLEDGYRSPAEWTLEPSMRDGRRYQLKNENSGAFLSLNGLTYYPPTAAVITLLPQESCAEFPELTVDAEGEIRSEDWPDGDLYGIAEIHSHIFSNRGFGGGSTFHGAPFHPLGVEHALPDCSMWHGPDGKQDIVGFFYDGNASDFDVDELAGILTSGGADTFNHDTAGYPTFPHWPRSWGSATHQTMYYRWIERAYLAGLRLIVQHATGNSVLCDLVTGINAQQSLYSCNDMVSVDRSIADARAMERYIDAQAGGPGQGWLRIVESPQEARDAIREGKLAMVLGIEISNVFDCFLRPPEGFEACTEASVIEKLDHYWDQGVRVVFPVHKFDNAFTAGDGSDGVIEIGNLINSGHYSNFVEDCPGLETAFDKGDVTFGGLNQPRDDYDSPPPIDTTRFAEIPVATLLPFLDALQEPALSGSYCQRHGFTDLGEFLMTEMMKRGMIIDIAHLPQRALDRAYDMLDDNGYPATRTHGSTNDGRIYYQGGMAGADLGRCQTAGQPGAMIQGYENRVAERAAEGHYASEALSFDLNGFAGGPRPRFGPDSNCGDPQTNPVEYPFTAYDGNVTFEEPQLGDRSVDFNEEGMIHIGLLPELIEDVRRDGVTDDQLEPLFRSAEAYVRMWEEAEAQAMTVGP